MSELGGQKRAGWGPRALRGQSLCAEAAASRLDLGEGQPGPSHLTLTLRLEAHPNSLIILPCVSLAEGEEDPLTPTFHHPGGSDPPLALMGREGDMRSPVLPGHGARPCWVFSRWGYIFKPSKDSQLPVDVKFENWVESQGGSFWTGSPQAGYLPSEARLPCGVTPAAVSSPEHPWGPVLLM